MLILLAVLWFFLLTACAPLSKHDSVLGDIGEVAGRTLLCPITFCVSEIGFYNNWKEEQQAIAHQENVQRYWERYSKLSPEEKDREDARREREKDRQAMREAAALNALGLINQGRGLLGPGYTPPPVRNYDTTMPASNPPVRSRQGVSCISRTSPYGGTVYTDCN